MRADLGRLSYALGFESGMFERFFDELANYAAVEQSSKKNH
ncbi:MAG TPA: hypothetical protein VKY35_02665 [Aliidiomarina sp.]|nr:hypothetical protein [Aliidiomarina sp.]